MMHQKILVPLDGSAAAEAVLPKVVMLARALAADVVLLRVTRARVFPGLDPTEAQVAAVREAEGYLAVQVEQLRLWGIETHSAVRYGDPIPEILDHIRTARVTLVAMASRARTGVSRLLLGSVAAAVLRHAGIPVLLLGPHHDAPASRAAQSVRLGSTLRSGAAAGESSLDRLADPRGRSD
jgi:nucleotide-binding universal stress UspA family protein